MGFVPARAQQRRPSIYLSHSKDSGHLGCRGGGAPPRPNRGRKKTKKDIFKYKDYLCIHYGGVGQALVDEDMNHGGDTEGGSPAVIDPDHQAMKAPVAPLQGFSQGDHPVGVADLKQSEGISPHEGVAKVCVGASVRIYGGHGPDDGAGTAGGWKEGVGLVGWGRD
ncbi:hypothetical protein EYF80_032024 [Liparis tanakae]|uniref:Uncharacterized protein n=1 Tax=Liparis tanakae TaxID=230148 RepID=A0A4Z2GW49_9TELE|nr:hypothetical protein EYF80_032024 [Liparis tanakae]